MQQTTLSPHLKCIVCQDLGVRRLHIPDDVRAQLVAEAERASPNETGGILVGFRAGDTVTVVAASDAGPNAVCAPERFERDGPHCQRFLERVVHERGGGVDYVGEWHSHPRSSSQPSLRDLESLLSISHDPDYLTDRPVMVIVAFPRGVQAGFELGATCHPKGGLVHRLALEGDQSFESGTERGTPPAERS
jgi:integrative and conjugative element protein (TIGR02256 family)